MKFEHKGIAIEMTAAGEFKARVSGQMVTKPSLVSMKNHIDKQSAAQFEAFTALREANHNERARDGLVIVEVVGLRRTSRSRFGDTYGFELKGQTGNGYSPGRLLVDTPENRDAYRAAEKYREETRKIERAREKVQDKLDSQVSYISANDYAV